jgi:hypothetical protein
MYKHDLPSLIELDATLYAALQADMTRDFKLEANWKTVKDWKNEKRYDVIDEPEARSLYDAPADMGSGVIPWIRGRW